MKEQIATYILGGIWIVAMFLMVKYDQFDCHQKRLKIISVIVIALTLIILYFFNVRVSAPAWMDS